MRIFLLMCAMVVALHFPKSVYAQSSDGDAWTRMSGTAVDIAINADGQAYVVAPDGRPWRWDKVEQRWRNMSGNFNRITAAEGNRPWAIDDDGVVYRYNGLWWENKDTDVVDVAADTNGNVYIAKANGDIKKWYALRSEWQPIVGPGSVKRIAVAPDGQLWAVLSDGRIRSYDGKAWADYPARALDIALGGTDVVMIVGADGLVRSWNGTQRAWVILPGVQDAISLGVTPDGRAWVVAQGNDIWANGSIISEQVQQNEDVASVPQAVVPVAKAPIAKVEVAETPAPSTPTAPVPADTTAQTETTNVTGSSPTAPGSTDPATITAKATIKFVDTRQSIIDLAIGADGSVFGLADGGAVMRWSNAQQRFKTFPGSLVRLAVDRDGNPWGISALGRVFRHNGQQWRQIHNATAVDIAVGYDGSVIIANASGRLLKLNGDQTRFEMIPGNGVAVAVAPDGTPWTIRFDKLLQRCDVSPCQIVPQRALSLSIGPDGSVWIVSERNMLMRLKADGKTFETVSTPAHTPWKVAVGPNGYPWVVSDARVALASHYFPRDEQTDVSVAAATTGNTTGTGTTTTVTVSSTSTFTFSKNMQFETVSYSTLSSIQYAILASDIDGVIWATTQGGAMDKYSAAHKKFIDAKTKFTDDGSDIDSFDIAPNGDIWAYTLNPQTGIFRERNKVLKKYSVSGFTAGGAIAVAPDGTVFAGFNDGSTYYIYTKAPASEVFTRFTQARANKISVGPGSDLWITDGNNDVYQWTGKKFEKRPTAGQKANRIAISKTDGTIYILDTSNVPRKWNSTNKSFDKINNITGYNIAVDENGRPWINTNNDPVIKRARD